MENKDLGSHNVTNENAANSRISSARKEGIARGALISGIIAVVVLIAGVLIVQSNFKKEKTRQQALLEGQKEVFTQQVSERDSVINDWLMTVDQIEKDLRTIKEKENLLTVSSGTEVTQDRRHQILEDIRQISNLIEANKKKIASLTSQLRSSGNTIKGLETRIANLETTVKQYEADMVQLKETLAQKDTAIGELNTQVTALEETVTQKDEMLNSQTLKINEAYLASGTFRELKEKGIVDKEGGFLGIGRKESLVGDVKDSMFSRIDVREMKVIPVNSRTAKLITEHPTNSYALIPEGDNKVAYLEIKDPDQFWKISRYAVVEIVK